MHRECRLSPALTALCAQCYPLVTDICSYPRILLRVDDLRQNIWKVSSAQFRHWYIFGAVEHGRPYMQKNGCNRISCNSSRLQDELNVIPKNWLQIFFRWSGKWKYLDNICTMNRAWDTNVIWTLFKSKKKFDYITKLEIFFNTSLTFFCQYILHVKRNIWRKSFPQWNWFW